MNWAAIKRILYDFFINSLIFYAVVKAISGITTSGRVLHWLMAFAVFALANLLVKQTIKFLTLPSNFFTIFIVSSILNFAAIYGMSLIIPGIQIGETLIDPVSIGIISVNPYRLTSFLTMVLASLYAALLSSVLNWLRKSE